MLRTYPKEWRNMKREKIELQLFAEGEEPKENNTTPTEQVENPENQTTEFEENPSEEAKTEDEGEKEADLKAKEEAQKEAARQAYIRRQQEKEQKRLEQERRNAYLEGIKKSTNGINRFTNKPISDEEDMKEYEAMLELEKQGRDPIEDYAEYLKEQRRAERKARELEAQKEQENDKRVYDEISNFEKAYGKGKAQEVLKDKDFMDFGKDLIDSGASLSSVYKAYMNAKTKIEKKSEQMLIEKQASAYSSPGSNKAGENNDKSFASMSDEEFENYRKRLLGRTQERKENERKIY